VGAGLVGVGCGPIEIGPVGGPGDAGGCVPSCTGRRCGSDGCGGSCGTCSPGDRCDSSGTCVPTPTGSIGPNGGTVSSLYFAVVGDTRPGNIDATSSYPTAIITKIYQD